jgi:hypothetical protein
LVNANKVKLFQRESTTLDAQARDDHVIAALPSVARNDIKAVARNDIKSAARNDTWMPYKNAKMPYNYIEDMDRTPHGRM